LALKLGGGGKGVEGLPKTVSLSLRGRVKDGVGLHWYVAVVAMGVFYIAFNE